MTILTDSEAKEQQYISESIQNRLKRMFKRQARVNTCDDCGQPTDNQGYCDDCNLRHLQFSALC